MWLDAGYNGQETRGRIGYTQRSVGWTAENRATSTEKPVPEELMKTWMKEWAKEEMCIDREKLPEGPKYPRTFLPKRWIVERTFSWLAQNRRMSKDYERLPESGEAFIYVALRAA